MEKKRSFTLTPIFTPFLAAILLILLSVSGKLFSSYNDIEENPNEFLLLISVVQLIVFVFPCIIYYFLKGRKLNTPFLISPIKPGQIVFVISSALLLVSGNLLIKCFYYIGLGSLPSGVDYLISDTGQLSDANMLTVIISIALIPAVCEELFFRGIVLSEYKIYGTFNAVLFRLQLCHDSFFPPLLSPLLLFGTGLGGDGGGNRFGVCLCDYSFYKQCFKYIYKRFIFACYNSEKRGIFCRFSFGSLIPFVPGAGAFDFRRPYVEEKRVRQAYRTPPEKLKAYIHSVFHPRFFRAGADFRAYYRPKMTGVYYA